MNYFQPNYSYMMYPQQNMYVNNNPYQYSQGSYVPPGTSIQDTILNGGFGYNSPQPNNILPIGGGYSTNNYQPSYYQQPKYDYYNPYGAPIQQNNIYNGYNNQYYQPNMYNSYQQNYYNQMNDYAMGIYEMNKIRAKMASGQNFDEAKFDERFKPKPYSPRQYTKEELAIIEYEKKAPMYIGVIEKPYTNDSIFLNAYIASYQKPYEDHDAYTYICKDVPRMLEQEWIMKNTKEIGRDFSKFYDSNKYSQLLRFHRDNSELLMDLAQKKLTNSEDYEMGLATVNRLLEEQKQAYKNGILKNPLSDLTKNPELMKKRNDFINACLQRVQEKNQLKAAKQLGLEE